MASHSSRSRLKIQDSTNNNDHASDNGLFNAILSDKLILIDPIKDLEPIENTVFKNKQNCSVVSKLLHKKEDKDHLCSDFKEKVATVNSNQDNQAKIECIEVENEFICEDGNCSDDDDNNSANSKTVIYGKSKSFLAVGRPSKEVCTVHLENAAFSPIPCGDSETSQSSLSSAKHLEIPPKFAKKMPSPSSTLKDGNINDQQLINLTEEEIEALLAAGYAVPTNLPLTNNEEKYLRKIKQRLRNRMHAQASRLNKKKYVSELENSVKHLAAQNENYKKRIEHLEKINSNLEVKVQELKSVVSRETYHLIFD